MGDENEENEFCGLSGCHPTWIQKLANINWFLVCLSIISIIQGILVSGITSASIPHLEREFGLTSTHSGYITASNDIGGLLFVLFIGYYGEKGNKPKWIGHGAIITGIGGFIFSLPKILKGRYEAAVIPVHFQDFVTCNLNNNDTVRFGCEGSTSSLGYLTIFCLSQFIMGLGTTPLYTLGAAYLDGNVNPKNSPIYIGIWYMSTFLGPSLGFLLGGIVLNQYVDLGKVPLDLNANSPTWVGRWWLPFVSLSLGLIVFGCIMLFFPKSMPGTKRIRKKAIEAGEIEQPRKYQPEGGLKGFIKATFELITNKTLILVILAMTSKVLIGSGLGPFFTKLTVIKFGSKPSESNFWVGIMVLFGTGVGLGAGSVIMRKIKVKGSVRVAAFICCGLSLCGVATGFHFYIPGCNTIQLVGVNNNYLMNTITPRTHGLLDQCNKECNCLTEYYHPVCLDGITYFSPCFAGCTNKTRQNYKNCSCLIPTANTTALLHPLLSNGKCNQDCKNLEIYLTIVFFVLIISFANGTPNNMMVLRSVPADRRSFAMSLQFLIMRALGNLPGPVFVGKIIDSSCLVWKYDECGKKSNCLEYDIDKLSIILSTFLSSASGVAFVLYAMTYITYRPIHHESHDGKEENADNNDRKPGHVNTAFIEEGTRL